MHIEIEWQGRLAEGIEDGITCVPPLHSYLRDLGTGEEFPEPPPSKDGVLEVNCYAEVSGRVVVHTPVVIGQHGPAYSDGLKRFAFVGDAFIDRERPVEIKKGEETIAWVRVVNSKPGEVLHTTARLSGD